MITIICRAAAAADAALPLPCRCCAIAPAAATHYYALRRASHVLMRHYADAMPAFYAPLTLLPLPPATIFADDALRRQRHVAIFGMIFAIAPLLRDAAV